MNIPKIAEALRVFADAMDEALHVIADAMEEVNPSATAPPTADTTPAVVDTTPAVVDTTPAVVQTNPVYDSAGDPPPQPDMSKEEFTKGMQSLARDERVGSAALHALMPEVYAKYAGGVARYSALPAEHYREILEFVKAKTVKGGV